MAPSNLRGNQEHEWSAFELHTLLCLMCRGMHLGGMQPVSNRNKGIEVSTARQHAYLNVATELNKAVNNGNYQNDIDRRAVASKIDEILAEKKGFVAYMERQRVGRLTRSMKLVWDRMPPINFLGTKAEWEGGRRDREMLKAWELKAAKANDSGGPIMQSIENRALHNNASHLDYGQAPAQAVSPSSRQVEAFFDQMESEMNKDRSMAPISYQSTALSSNVEPADYQVIDETIGAESRGSDQGPRGENAVPLPFNRLEQARAAEYESDMEMDLE